uniref:Uncharacterized protein n=1 Tax=Rhizophora mucronata TaxID=61149 RepID=A0A2P2NA17_RHIMU
MEKVHTLSQAEFKTTSRFHCWTVIGAAEEDETTKELTGNKTSLDYWRTTTRRLDETSRPAEVS